MILALTLMMPSFAARGIFNVSGHIIVPLPLNKQLLYNYLPLLTVPNVDCENGTHWSFVIEIFTINSEVGAIFHEFILKLLPFLPTLDSPRYVAFSIMKETLDLKKIIQN